MTGMRPTMASTLSGTRPRLAAQGRGRRRPGWIVQSLAIPSCCARYPSIHRPSRPARRAGLARHAGRQPALVLAPAHAGRVPCRGPRGVGRRQPRPGATPRERWAGPGSRSWPRDEVFRAAARVRPQRPGDLPERGAVVPPLAAVRTRRAPIALLLAGVRHHRRAAAVLRRPRHPRRRPPQGRLRPRRPADRRRAALQARLLQAVAAPRGLAAGDLPGPRPRRAAARAAARGGRHPRHGVDRPAGRPRPGRPDLRRQRRPGPAAAARQRRRAEPAALPRRHRPAVRRHQRAPAAPGAPARRRRRPRAPRLLPASPAPRSPRSSTPTRATPASSAWSGSASSRWPRAAPSSTSTPPWSCRAPARSSPPTPRCRPASTGSRAS